MKNLIFAITSLIVLSTTNSLFAQRDWQGARNILSTNPIAPVFGKVLYASEYALFYEKAYDYAITNQNRKTFFIPAAAIRIGVSYLSTSRVLRQKEIQKFKEFKAPNINYDFEKDSIRLNGIRIQGMYKRYLSSYPFPKGLYIGPHYSVLLAKVANKHFAKDNLILFSTDINAILGFQLLFVKRIVIDIYSGFGFEFKYWKNKMDNSKIFNSRKSVTRFRMPFGLNLGVAF